MVVWIIGLSGVGKTTLANEVIARVRSGQSNAVLIDGDAVRETFGNDLGHTMGDRLINAGRICRLCKFLDDQGINVVCAILSLFPESQLWNRENLNSYYEVFIDTPIQDLVERDSKGIYRKYNNGEASDVVGMDIEFRKPEYPDLVIENIDTRESLLNYAESIAERIISEN